MKKWILLTAVLLCLLFTGCQSEEITICNAEGTALRSIDESLDFGDDSRRAYFDIVVTEAVEILAEQGGCSTEDARKDLFSQKYTILTAYDVQASRALEQACRTVSDTDVGCAITDLKGNLIAAYTSSDINYAARQAAPYSALKPLSVYAQTIEKGLINWSSTYEDSPYKQIPDQSTGTTEGWPSNPEGTYAYEDVFLYEAIRKSLNTVAVKCLAELGVSESIQFLQKQFHMPLDAEQYALSIYGEEELIGNLALGYLETGVSPVDMAGYYQIFANGGVYAEPRAILEIRDESGSTVYKAEKTSRQVISQSTAMLMNQLLQEVVDMGGTGEEAVWGKVQVAGKTGTGDDYSDNWFVGVTPGYSCAVWHSAAMQNSAPEIFSQIMEGIYGVNSEEIFFPYAQLKKVVFCQETGLMISAGCASIELGYYAEGDEPGYCQLHQ